MPDERTISIEEVRKEHLEQVDQRAHWAYLFGVLSGSTVLMLLVIAALGAGSGTGG